MPAYDNLGFGEIKDQWPWCPRWYWEHSEETLDDMRTYEAISEAYIYREKGELGNLVEPPWTAALTDGLMFFTGLEMEKERMQRERDKAKRGR